jgi:hypothetical protein
MTVAANGATFDKESKVALSFVAITAEHPFQRSAAHEGCGCLQIYRPRPLNASLGVAEP